MVGYPIPGRVDLARNDTREPLLKALKQLTARSTITSRCKPRPEIADCIRNFRETSNEADRALLGRGRWAEDV